MSREASANEEKKDLGNSTKMLKGLEEPKNLDRRARHVIESIGAKVRSPNLTTQLSDVEQQIRAELSWNQHDYQIWRIAQAKDEDYKELFSRPDQAKQQMRKCVLHFSDQIPLWVKKPSNKEVFAAHEAKKSAKDVTSHREKIREELDKKAHEKGIVETENQQKGDEEKDQQIVPHDEGEEWHIPEAADRKSSGKKHLTTMREQNVDKYRITFEAHQSVLNFFDPDENPLGVVSPGILIVPGPHASLANISETGEWLQDETYTYMGQKRTHKKGNNVGRTLEPWRKLRKDEPQLLRHFHVYSQPSSNTDGIIMSWVIRDMSHKAGMRLHQRDCFGAAFVDQVRQMQFLAHEVPSSIVAKMTSALQLTDTDFSRQFKACVRQSVDETMRTGMQKQRRDEATPSEQYKMSLRDVAVALDSSMQRMIDRNDEDQWVLAGLRRNGFLAFRPDRSGHMVYQQDQSWCKDKPIGSTRISSHWLKNRMSWIKEAGRSVDPPIWERIEGAKELADLLEWSYQQQGLEKNEAVLDLEGADEPDWVTCGQFQLPLDLRRDLSIREKTLPEEARKKREKIRSKRNEKKMRTEAKKALSQQQREEILSNLQSKSRLEAMMDIKPSAKKPTAKLIAKKKKNQKKQESMSLAAKHEKATKKKDKKNAIKNVAVKLLKKGKSAQKVDEPPAGAPPLPPPALPPPADEPAAAYEVPSGKLRIISEFAGPMLFGRQGSAMGAGETQIQLHLESDPRNSFERVAWVDRAWVMSIDESIKPSWVFPQLSLGRQAKQHILLQSGTCHVDVDEMDLPWDEVELVPKDMGADGLDGQHIIYGWLVLCYMASGKKLDEIQGISMLSPALVCSLAADNPADNEFVSHELLCKCLKKKMAGKDDTFLCPLASGGHWSLLVVDKHAGEIRYYDSLCGSDDRKKIGTEEEISNLPEKTVAMAERLLGIMQSLGCISEGMLHCPALHRQNQKSRQPYGSNLCGQYLLAYAEQEVG